MKEDKVYLYGCKVNGEYFCGITRNVSMKKVVEDVEGNYGSDVTNITVTLLDIVDVEE